MVFQIRCFHGRIGFGEHSELAWRHRHRAGLGKCILQPNKGLSDQAVRQRIQCFGVSDLEDGSYLQVILQVFSDPGTFVLGFDSKIREDGSIPDTR